MKKVILTLALMLVVVALNACSEDYVAKEETPYFTIWGSGEQKEMEFYTEEQPDVKAILELIEEFATVRYNRHYGAITGSEAYYLFHHVYIEDLQELEYAKQVSEHYKSKQLVTSYVKIPLVEAVIFHQDTGYANVIFAVQYKNETSNDKSLAGEKLVGYNLMVHKDDVWKIVDVETLKSQDYED